MVFGQGSVGPVMFKNNSLYAATKMVIIKMNRNKLTPGQVFPFGMKQLFS